MIRINLLRSQRPGGKAPKTMVSPREAVFAGVLLVAALGMLFYLAVRPKPSPAPPTVAQPAAAPPPPEKKVEAVTAPPKVEAPPPPAEPPVPAAKTEPPAPPPSPTPAAGCQIAAIGVEKRPQGPALVLRASTAVKFKSFELSKPDRIVVDVLNCVGTGAQARVSQEVQDPAVQKVRAGQFQADVFRVVVEMTAMPRYQIVPAERGLEIRILGGKQ